MRLLHGDCLEVLRQLENNSIDSLVTDPPAGISFMGKYWDDDKGGRKQWIAWMTEVMQECFRVMKPGAHGLVWALPRTSHWTATALEDAGFEIRDVVTHLFGSGFPKSLDISKAIDKAAGLERARIPGGQGGTNNILKYRKPGEAISGEAKQWQGWGTALKPASEHWILIRKPISEKTVAANVLKWGTGGLNIDGSRIGTEIVKSVHHKGDLMRAMKGGASHSNPTYKENVGRFPANLVLSHSEHCLDDQCDIECAIKMLDGQSGPCKTGGRKIKTTGTGASRFFYVAKASKRERNAGCDLGVKKAVGNRPKSADMTGKFPDHDQRERVGNFHPTVKSTKLMAYLIKLITPPGGIVLDPFMGSGSTGVAAKRNGFKFVGIEKEREYFEIAEKRIG